ncbi:MAG TPA: hypothetical protein VJ873_02285 [bacterium]|nr:hypothetical protein [bacterium]
MDSISFLGLNTPQDFGSFFNALGGNAVGFGNIFSQAMSQAKTPGDAAKIDWMQAEYSDLMDLSTLGSGSVSALAGMGMGDLFGFGSPLGLPSWAQDAERLLGSTNSDLQQTMSAYQQAAFALQSQFNQSLADFGSTGGSVNSLI